MRASGRGIALALGLGTAVLLGCSGPTDQERRARLLALAEADRDLNTALDAVELRLMRNQGTVAMWRELAQRHRDVSEVACHNLSGHYEAMARFMDSQQVRSGRIRTRVVAEVDAEVAHGRRALKHW
jgi:hypothetical protein